MTYQSMQAEPEQPEPVVVVAAKPQQKIVGDEIHDRVDELQSKWGIRMIRLKKGQ